MGQKPLYNLPSKRAFLTETAGGLEVRIAPSRHGVILFCYAALVFGLAWGSLFASRTGRTVVAILLVALTLRFFFNLLWVLIGTEHVTLSPDLLVIRRSLVRCQFVRREYKLSEVSSLRVEPFFRDLGL